MVSYGGIIRWYSVGITRWCHSVGIIKMPGYHAVGIIKTLWGYQNFSPLGLGAPGAQLDLGLFFVACRNVYHMWLGGYTTKNVARCWANETALLVDQPISSDIPLSTGL